MLKSIQHIRAHRQSYHKVSEQRHVSEAISSSPPIEHIPFYDELEGVALPSRGVGGDHVHVTAHKATDLPRLLPLSLDSITSSANYSHVLYDEIAPPLDVGDALNEERSLGGSEWRQCLHHNITRIVLFRNKSLEAR